MNFLTKTLKDALSKVNALPVWKSQKGIEDLKDLTVAEWQAEWQAEWYDCQRRLCEEQRENQRLRLVISNLRRECSC